MKKDYSFHRKRSVIYGVAALTLMLLVMLPIFLGIEKNTMGFIFEHKQLIVYLQIMFTCIAITGYLLSVYHQNSYTTILRNERLQKKKADFINIVKLVRNNKNDEAIDALYDYDNKYN